MSARVAITGAASGIGQASAQRLREKGARVVGLDLNASEVGDVLACDVRDQESVDAAVAAAVERLGGLDVLVNCAGVGFAQSAGERPDEKALAVLDINLMGTWRVTAAALDALRDARGRVINVASGLAFLTVPFATAYCASKRGVTAYSEALRLEHGDALTVTTVYPGYIKTPIHESSAEQGVGLDGLVPEEPLSAAAATIERAALGRPVRDRATTRRGDLAYALLRLTPRRLVQEGVLRQMRRHMAGGEWDDSPLAGDMARRRRAA